MAGKSTDAKNVKEVDIAVGKKVHELRLKRKMTYQQLASKIGVTHQQLQKYERGTNRIAVSRLVDLADALQVSVMYFFNDNIIRPEQEQIDKQHVFLECMADFLRINNKEQQDAIKELIRTFASESADGSTDELQKENKMPA